MKEGQFSAVGIHPGSPKWEQCIARQKAIYNRQGDIRSDFLRDYNRILHSTAYRRLKQKTQVFFATRNDHVCTRIEHVNHVAAVSLTISKFLGLNTELTSAIAIGHDLGHAPFGHTGEEILNHLAAAELGETFWHEKNSLRLIDKCETLPDPWGNEQNLNLTYGVRDGIICHCGEVDETAIFPRNEAIDLESIEKANQYSPYTWEGCVVKISDKIAYLGRDIEDARRLKILTDSQLKELQKIIKDIGGFDSGELNSTVLMHDFVVDLCSSSSPEDGIVFSDRHLRVLKELKNFNYRHIYKHERLDTYCRYARLIIESVYNSLKELWSPNREILSRRIAQSKEYYPLLSKNFYDWLIKYSNLEREFQSDGKYINDIIYNVEMEKHYIQAIIDFISGMTDGFAIRLFNELTTF